MLRLELLENKQRMKVIKIIILSILLSLCVFLILRNSEKINLEGDWTATKIVLNGKEIFPTDPPDKYFDLQNQIVINNWSHSIVISAGGNEINTNFIIKENDDRNNRTILLTSKENSLNGNFNIKIDTIHTGPQSYRVDVKLQSGKTYLYFERQVAIPPWKPEFPKKGRI